MRSKDISDISAVISGWRALLPWILLLLWWPLSGAAMDECPAWSHAIASEQLAERKQRLDAWELAYRQDGSSPVSDDVFDQAWQRYQELGVCFPLAVPDAAEAGASLSVDETLSGDETLSDQQLAHPVAHGGLRKAEDIRQVEQWLDRVCAEPPATASARPVASEDQALSRDPLFDAGTVDALSTAAAVELATSRASGCTRDIWIQPKVDGIGPVTAQRLFDVFSRTPDRSFSRWIRALGAPATGDLDESDSWSGLVAMTQRDWLAREGVGSVGAARWRRFVMHPEVQALAQQLAGGGVAGFAESHPVDDGATDVAGTLAQ